MMIHQNYHHDYCCIAVGYGCRAVFYTLDEFFSNKCVQPSMNFHA